MSSKTDFNFQRSLLADKALAPVFTKLVENVEGINDPFDRGFIRTIPQKIVQAVLLDQEMEEKVPYFAHAMYSFGDKSRDRPSEIIDASFLAAISDQAGLSAASPQLLEGLERSLKNEDAESIVYLDLSHAMNSWQN